MAKLSGAEIFALELNTTAHTYSAFRNYLKNVDPEMAEQLDERAAQFADEWDSIYVQSVEKAIKEIKKMAKEDDGMFAGATSDGLEALRDKLIEAGRAARD